MDELGSILRDAREMKGLTLAEVQEQIRINSQYLDALEEGNYHLLPTQVHLRGFLRNYARFLDLDPDPLLEKCNAAYLAQSEQARQASSENGADPVLAPREDQPFFEPVNMDLDGSSGGAESTVRIAIIVALLITIGLAASRFLPLVTGEGDGRDNLPQMIESLMASDDGTTEDSGETMSVGPQAGMPDGTSDPIIPSERNNPAGVATDTASAPPTRPPLPAAMDEINLRLDITERTWVRVIIDGEVALEDQITREDGPFEWQALQEAHVLTGNAAGVFVTINDVQVGKLGERGAVAEERWTTTAAGN